MRQGRSSRRCFLGLLLLVTIAILSVSNIPLAQAEEVAEAAVDATGDVEVQTEEVPAEADGPVEEEPVVVDEPVEEEEEPVAVDEPVEEESGEDEAAAEEAAEEEEAAVEEEETNVVREVTETAKSKISEIVGQIKDISPQQKKKIAAGALGVWGVAAGAGWVLNNLGGSDE
mmetsp:Transcript_23330/g.34604  ORF Transcript_23330/g.34604 Transcript_23330/m.34604 type:complete len:172 (+) Transcript_23330:82-597(+)